MEQHPRDDDESLLDDLAAALDEVAPQADRIARQARGAFAWRTVDSDLSPAGLSFDSWLEWTGLEPTGHTRDVEGGSRVLVFTAAPLTLEVELLSDRIVGQILPPGVGEIVVESADGSSVRIEADELGFFILARRPDGPVRLRCDTPTARLVTDWVQL